MWNIFHKSINKIINPISGLGKRMFLIVSQLTPLCNVELVVKDSLDKTLLIYRDDEFYGPGWHLPGGVIRFRENVETRIYLTLLNELKIKKSFVSELKLISCYEIINSKKILRSHFISLLYYVKISKVNFKAPIYDNLMGYKNGDIAYHIRSPRNLLKEHLRYKEYIDDISKAKDKLINKIKTVNL